MTKARELGLNAKEVAEGVEEALIQNNGVFFDVVLDIYSGNMEAAINKLKEAAARNQQALRALTLMLSKKYEDAIRVLRRSL